MTALFCILVAIAAIWTLAYIGVSRAAWSAAVIVYFGALALFGVIGGLGLLIAAIVVVPILAIFNISSLRRSLVTKPIFAGFKAVLPPMSDTEREALEAGSTWWETEMFRGKPDWQYLLDFKRTQLTDEEQSFLDNETEQLCAMLDEWEVTHELKDLPEAAWTYIRENKFFAMLIPKEHDGLGFSAVAQSTVVAKIASRSLTAAITVMVPNSLGPGELLTHYGTKAQQQYWLPGLADGSQIPCFGLTGPEVGSDAGALPDTGVVCRGEYNGEQVLGMKLTFSKRWITLAPIATVIGLAFKLYDPEGLLGDKNKTDYGIPCALIKASEPGVEIGRRHCPGAFMNGPIYGKDVFVPLDAIIGGQEKAGGGWRMLVECLSAGRGISLPALSSAESELYGLSTSVCDLLMCAQTLEEMGLVVGTVTLCTDSRGARLLAMDCAAAARTRHIHRRWYFVRYHIDEKRMYVRLIKGSLNRSNFLTKAVGGAPFAADRAYSMGVRE